MPSDEPPRPSPTARTETSSAGAANDPQTAALAITYLQAQLGQASSAYDSLDQKATLLPVFLAGIALFLVPQGDRPFGVWQVALFVPALVTGGTAVWFTYQALKTRKVPAGPLPDDVAEKMDRPFAEFGPALAGVIGEATTARRDALSEKAKAFNKALSLAAATFILVMLARLIGGLIVSEDNSNAQPSPAPSAPAGVAPTTPSPTPATTPTDTPMPTPVPTPTPTPELVPPSPSVEPTTSDVEPMFAMAYEYKALTPTDMEVRKAEEAPKAPASDKSERSEPG